MSKIPTKDILDIDKIRSEFPILSSKMHGKPLVFLDTAASSQKPNCVTDAIKHYYECDHANVHRGVYQLSQRATDEHESARRKIQDFVHAKHDHEIIFTKGTTESLNLIANGFRPLLTKDDVILISYMEHHSNIVPWQFTADATGATLKVIPINQKGELDMDAFHQMMNDKVKIVSLNHISNALGTINPIKEIIDSAHQFKAAVCIDGAQALPHLKIDVQDLDVDFYVGSGHKMYGPTGIGFLYGKEEWLHKLAPYQGGGEMISSVSFEKTTYNDLPFKFEAGTPNIAGTIGIAAAVDFIERLGQQNIAQHEHKLLAYATAQLKTIEGLKIYGEADSKASVISFNIGSIHPFDIGTMLDQQGIAVRTGHHCTEPLMKFFNVPGTVRASFGVYNTIEEIDLFVNALKKAKSILS